MRSLAINYSRTTHKAAELAARRLWADIVEVRKKL